MNKRVVVSTVLGLAALVLLYLWFTKSEVAEIVAETHVPAPVAELAVAKPEQPEVPEVVQQAPLQSTHPPLETSRPAARQIVATQVGTYTKAPSVELRTYYMLMGLGGSGFSSPESTRQEFDLSDEELAELTEYAKSAVESDLKHQLEMQRETCEGRATFQTLEQFGAAMNGFTEKVERNQESLARDARDKLGGCAVCQNRCRRRRQRARDVLAVDGPSSCAPETRSSGID